MASPTRKLINGLAVVLIVLSVLVGFGTSAEAQAQRVTQIQVRIITANVSGAGTNASIFLGMVGREFRLDSDNPCGDFEQGQDVIYRLGVNAGAEFLVNPGVQPGGMPCPIGQFSLNNAADNDPRVGGLGIPLGDVLQLPIYIRMSDVSFAPNNPLNFPADDWLVDNVFIVARTGNNAENFVASGISPTLNLLRPGEFLQLGSTTGFYIHFIPD